MARSRTFLARALVLDLSFRQFVPLVGRKIDDDRSPRIAAASCGCRSRGGAFPSTKLPAPCRPEISASATSHSYATATVLRETDNRSASSRVAGSRVPRASIASVMA